VHTFNGVLQQREFGYRVARKVLGLSNEVLAGKLTGTNETTLSPLPNLITSIEPIFGVVIEEVLRTGEEMQCGRHGYSIRDGGFRFETRRENDPYPHPHSNDPLVLEDPVQVMNNVSKNSYKAPMLQKAFAEAMEKFKNLVVRYRCDEPRNPLKEIFCLDS
jgi:hypothetical protein